MNNLKKYMLATLAVVSMQSLNCSQVGAAAGFEYMRKSALALRIDPTATVTCLNDANAVLTKYDEKVRFRTGVLEAFCACAAIYKRPRANRFAKGIPGDALILLGAEGVARLMRHGWWRTF